MATVVSHSTTELDRVRAFAERPENLYRFPESGFVAGDRPEYVAEVEFEILNPNIGHLKQRLRIVFTITEFADKRRFRHASISFLGGTTSGVNTELAEGVQLTSDGLPAPSAVQAVGTALGFNGVVEEWITGFHEHERGIIVIAQPLEDS